MRKIYILGILISILVASCESRFIDMSRKLPVEEISKTSSGEYGSIAWISEQKIGVVIDEPDTEESNGSIQHRPTIGILDVISNKLSTVSIDDACGVYYVRALQVLPNQELGYIFECPPISPVSIQQLNTKAIESRDLYVESTIPFLGDFAYSKDMREVILVDVRGLFLKSSLYHLDTNRKKTNITPDFLRADFPVWSPKTNLIAFFGTKPYPGSNDKIEEFSQTERRLDYPWRLYIYNPESQGTEELPLDIVHPSSLKWSPDGKRLAFSGEYEGIPGVWAVDNIASQNDLRITRVVDGSATFDFSPDGRSIAFAYIGLQNKERQNVLYVVNLPEQNANVK